MYTTAVGELPATPGLKGTEPLPSNCPYANENWIAAVDSPEPVWYIL